MIDKTAKVVALLAYLTALNVVLDLKRAGSEHIWLAFGLFQR